FILNDFSFVALGVLLICLFLYCSKNSRFVQNSNNYILLSFTMIMPLGYLFMHIEPRFVWTVYLIIIILSGVLLTMLKDVQWMTPALFVLICIIVFSSFCLYPINQLQDQRYKGQDAYDIYAAFKKRNIHGTFVANSSTNNEEAKLKIFAYLSKSHFIITHPAITEEEILQVIKYYQANYYIMYYTSSYEKEGMLHSTVAKNAADVLIDVSPGVIVFRFK
ncbi:MAG: hypothetical protein HY305_02515, partial [Sphingobacteriales bacterium]|nr:hypothetical protein [Sphingobacteriales bacterium]